MTKANHIKLLSSILVVFFVISSIVSGSFAALRTFHEFPGLALTEQEGASCKWADVVIEEKEIEEENIESAPGLQGNLFFIGFTAVTETFTATAGSNYTLYNVPRACGNATNLPLYLATRSLLI